MRARRILIEAVHDESKHRPAENNVLFYCHYVELVNST